MGKIILAFFVGVIVTLISIVFIQSRNRRRRLKNKRKKKVSIDTYAKLITTVVVAHGMILTSCSYILSYLGMDPVVDVSSTIVKEIVAPLVVYLGTNMIMNIFEKNKLIFSTPLNTEVVGRENTNTDNGAVG